MSIVFLNGQYLPAEQASISPMDRGFLFGDGIYEVIPCHTGRPVGFHAHMQRLANGLSALDIELGWDASKWHAIIDRLLLDNQLDNAGIYLHISRGADTSRFHAYPKNIEPTVFAFAFEIAPQKVADKDLAAGCRVQSSEDLRWRRCHIKSTSLLGNVMHFQQGVEAGVDETILFNQAGELTEAAACNVFIVKDDVVITPPLDHQLLPGITRQLLLDILRKDGVLDVQERTVHMDEVRDADEVWLTSSSREIAPVIELDGQPVGNGQVGDIWQLAQALFNQHKFEY